VTEPWETEDVEVTKPVGIVVSVRFPQEIAARIYTEAKRRGVSTSTIIRDAVETWLDAPVASSAAGDVSLSSANGSPVSFTQGRSTSGRTAGSDATTVVDLVPAV
jgi:predicted transcriptional regulator